MILPTSQLLYFFYSNVISLMHASFISMFAKQTFAIGKHHKHSTSVQSIIFSNHKTKLFNSRKKKIGNTGLPLGNNNILVPHGSSYYFSHVSFTRPLNSLPLPSLHIFKKKSEKKKKMQKNELA